MIWEEVKAHMQAKHPDKPIEAAAQDDDYTIMFPCSDHTQIATERPYERNTALISTSSPTNANRTLVLMFPAWVGFSSGAMGDGYI